MPTINTKHIKELEQYLRVKKTPELHEEKLWRKTKKYKNLFKYIPGILCVCVCNSLAMNTAHKDSDIDLFIITKKNRLWTSRIFITLLVGLLRQRKTAHKHAGKFCLSFFITENHLDLQDIAIKNDIYLKYWIQTLVPIINKNHTFELFLEVNSRWCSLVSPHSGILSPLGEKGATKMLSSSPLKERRFRGEGKFLTGLGDICEKILKKIFLPRTKKSFQKLGKPFGIVISDDMLKFHNRDRRKEMRDIIFS